MDSEKTSLRIKQLREGLKWIAGQGCEAAGEYASCSDLPSNPCITEYCLPCYAAAILMQDDRQPAVPETVGVKALASATCSAAPPELVEAMKEINRHIEHLEDIGTISVTGSLLAARERQKEITAALCGAQQNGCALTGAANRGGKKS